MLAKKKTIDQIIQKAQISDTESIELKIDDDKVNDIGPLCIWNNTIENLTYIKRHEDVEPVYKLLVEMLNIVCYDKKLCEEPEIFI